MRYCLDASRSIPLCPGGDGVLRSMPAGPMSRIMLSRTETVRKDTDVKLWAAAGWQRASRRAVEDVTPP